MEDKFKTAARAESSHDEHNGIEKERVNAKLRHFRGVAVRSCQMKSNERSFYFAPF